MDWTRYARQMILPEIGGEGQKRLRSARVALVGLGGLGSPLAFYLAAAGVGRLRLVDPDPVEISNLHRQILHFTADLERPKTVSASEKLSALNPSVRLEVRAERFTAGNAGRLLKGCDLALDGSDNFETRYAVNAACAARKIPLVWGAVLRWQGQVSAVRPGLTACYQCLFPEPPDPTLATSCADAGILGGVAGVVGTLMAVEAIKMLLNRESLGGRLLLLDLLSLTIRSRTARRIKSCPACGWI